MAIESLSSVLPKWKEWALKANAQQLLKSATYPMPNCDPKFLGTIIQKYRLRQRGVAAAAFQGWIDQIEKKVEEILLPALKSAKMMMNDSCYNNAGASPSQPLMQMSDFNGLIALSQKHSAPVFALSDEQLGQTGIVLERTKKQWINLLTFSPKGQPRLLN